MTPDGSATAHRVRLIFGKIPLDLCAKLLVNALLMGVAAYFTWLNGGPSAWVKPIAISQALQLWLKLEAAFAFAGGLLLGGKRKPGQYRLPAVLELPYVLLVGTWGLTLKILMQMREIPTHDLPGGPLIAPWIPGAGIALLALVGEGIGRRISTIRRRKRIQRRSDPR